MADFEIPENPDFVESVRKFEPTDPAHADLFNRVILALLESLAYLRKYKADMDYVDLSYQQATGYADKIVAALINGAPEMLNTLDKLANAVEENASIIDVLVAAIGKKAEQVELDTHTGNNVIHITSAEHEGLTEAIKHTKTAHVTGVKGSAESIYRTENVEITAENVGLGNVDNTADSEKSVNYAASAGSVNWAGIKDTPSTYPPEAHTHKLNIVSNSTFTINNYSDNPVSIVQTVDCGEYITMGNVNMRHYRLLLCTEDKCENGIVTEFDITKNNKTLVPVTSANPAQMISTNENINLYFDIHFNYSENLGGWKWSWDEVGYITIYGGSGTTGFSTKNFFWVDCWAQ